MADPVVYIGSSARFDFAALENTPGGPKIVPLPSGTKLWSGVKRRQNNNDPPIITKENAAAGGDEQQARIADNTNGLFSVYLQKADTAKFKDGETYVIDGQYELADGTHAVAGLIQFEASNPVWQSPT